MIKIIGNLIKDNVNIDDKIIAESMISSAQGAALLYLDSTLTSTTPELRGIYAASIGQVVEGHTALTELCIKKEWIKPCEVPISQLSCSSNEAKDTISQK